PPQHFLLRKRSSALNEHCRKVVARDVLQHEKLSISYAEMDADARQRLMMEPGQQTRFALELFAQFLVRKERFFQGDGGIEPLVQRFVHGAHTALAELANNAVAPL